MDDLLYDVKALLDQDFGDDRILKQICRACERNELISNYERNYVIKLAEKHLGRRPKFVPELEDRSAMTSAVVIPDVSLEPIHAYKTDTSRLSFLNSKKRKIVFGVLSLALLTMVIGTVYFGDVSFGPGDTVPPVVKVDDKVDEEVDDKVIPVDDVVEDVIPLSINTDSVSYATTDLILISGMSDSGNSDSSNKSSNGRINLSITNQNGELVWSETVLLKSNGKFSTLTIAGGYGWGSSGTFTLKAEDGGETQSTTFSFSA